MHFVTVLFVCDEVVPEVGVKCSQLADLSKVLYRCMKLCRFIFVICVLVITRGMPNEVLQHNNPIRNAY